MEPLEVIRIVLAVIATFYWLVCLVANTVIGGIFLSRDRGPSSLPLVGSIGGVLAILIQPFSIPEPNILYWSMAFLPDLVWLGFGAIGILKDRTLEEQNN